jgi:hypothetical protein
MILWSADNRLGGRASSAMVSEAKAAKPTIIVAQIEGSGTALKSCGVNAQTPGSALETSNVETLTK